MKPDIEHLKLYSEYNVDYLKEVFKKDSAIYDLQNDMKSATDYIEHLEKENGELRRENSILETLPPYECNVT